MSLTQLNVSSFDKKIYDDKEACLVIFSKKNCPVCQGVIPNLEKLSDKYRDKFAFYYVDAVENISLLQRFSLRGVPQVLFFHGGEYQGRLSGVVEDAQIEEKIMEILQNLSK